MHKPTLASTRSWMRWSLLVGLLVGSISCQNDTVTASEEGEQEVRVTFRIGESYREPDSLAYRFKTSTGTADLFAKPDGRTFVASFRLPRAPGSDTVDLSLWRLGLRVFTLPATGSGDLDLDMKRLLREEFALAVLKRHDSLQRKDSSFFESSPLGVRRSFAKMLVDRDSLVEGYPARRPLGLDTVAMVDAICVAMARRKAAFTSLCPATFLGTDSADWHRVVLKRIASGVLASADSAVLFPLPPVGVTTEIDVKNALMAGGDQSDILGTFRWYKGMVSLDAVVLSGKDTVDGAFDVALQQQQNLSDTVWSLQGKATIRARSGAPTGEFQLRITARDAKGNTASSSAPFQVIKPATELPRLTRMEPVGKDTARIPFSDPSIKVAFQVGNPAVVDPATFTIAGLKASRENDSVWSAIVPVSPTGVPALVAGRVLNRDGLPGTAFLFVVRDRDTVAPGLVRAASTVDRELPFDSGSVEIAWSVKDDHKLDSVWIGGVPVAIVDGNCLRRVPLAVGKQVVRIRAKDSTGNRSTDSVTIARRPDTEIPELVSLLSPQDLEVVGGTTVQVMVAWSVSDNHKVERVLVDGEPAQRSVAGDIWSRIVYVDESERKIVVQAWDSTGNTRRDSVVVHKIANPDRPIVHTAKGTESKTVPFETREIELSWFVLNPGCLASVSISEVPAVAVDGRFTRKIVLPLGDTAVTLQAIDTLGKSTSNTVTIKRERDTLSPRIHPGPLDVAMIGALAQVTASWVVTDNDQVASVRIEGVEAARLGNVYSRTVGLQPGQDRVRVVAKDASGNTTFDSVLVKSDADALPPTITDGIGTKMKEVGQNVDQLLLSWIVADDRGVGKVEIAGEAVAGVGTAYGRIVALRLGLNSFTIEAWDAAGNKATKTTEIVRLDQSGPIVSGIEGLPTAPVAQGAESVEFSFRIDDETGIGKVTVAGAVVEGKDGLYTAKVPLKIGANSIEIVATDKAGTSTVKVVEVLRKDESAPVIEESSSPTASVLDEQTSYELKWTVSDNSGAFTATLDGVELPCVSGACSKTVDLAYGENVFVFKATDASGNQIKSAMKIERLDQKPPVVTVVTSATAGAPMIVSDADPVAVLKWKVADNVGVASCEANGAVVVAGADGVYSLAVDMASVFGDKLIEIVTRDAKGNISDPVRLVVRHADGDRPVVKWQDPSQDTTVLDLPGYVVKWSVKDNAELKTLTVNGQPVTIDASGSYSSAVELAFGANAIKIVATDASGNEVTEVLTITRKDKLPPTLTLLDPSKDTTVNDVASYLVKWEASDNVGLKSLTVNGNAVTLDATGGYSRLIDLSYGTNAIKIVATDASGNEETEVLTITRKDATPPSVTLVSPAPPVDSVFLMGRSPQITLQWTATDNVGVTTVVVNDEVVPPSTTGNYSVTINMTSSSSRDSVVEITAYDAVENVSEKKTVVLRRDRSAPVITWPGAREDSTVNVTAQFFEAKWTVTDDDKVEAVTINGVAATVQGGSYSRLVPVTLGDNAIRIHTEDRAGNVSEHEVVITVPSKIVSIAAGGYFGLALDDGGKVALWSGEGIKLPSGLGKVKTMAAAGRMALFVAEADGSVVAAADDISIPAVPTGLTKVRRVAVGCLTPNDPSGLAILDDSTVQVWGSLATAAPVVAAIASEEKAIDAAFGNGFIMLQRPDSTVWLWTSNGAPIKYGKAKMIGGGFGFGSIVLKTGLVVTVPSGTPTVPTGLSDVRMAQPGWHHVIGITETGAGAAWAESGGNGWKQAEIPAAFPTDAIAVAAGYRFSMVLTSQGTVLGWGESILPVPAFFAWTAP